MVTTLGISKKLGLLYVDPVSTEMGDRSRVYHLGIQPRRPGQLILVIPLWADEMNIGDGYSYC